jgi:nucleotide-binding universal stress UspA family protein
MHPISIHRILCPVDFSPFSRRALDHAIALARWYHATVHVLHVSPLDVPVGVVTPWASPPDVHTSGIDPESLRTMLRSFAQAEGAAGVAVESEVVEGPVADEIVAQTRLRGADLVVMGTHGRSGVKRLVLGSVTEKVLRAAACPVLTVPAAVPEAVPIAAGLFKRILCPTDFSPASRRSLQWALALAEEADAELCVLHVFEHTVAVEHETFPRSTLAAYRRAYEQWALERLHDEVPVAARSWCTVRELTAVGSAHREIVRLAAERHCDLVVMGVGRSRDLADRLVGSTTQQVVRGAACPVLSVIED